MISKVRPCLTHLLSPSSRRAAKCDRYSMKSGNDTSKGLTLARKAISMYKACRICTMMSSAHTWINSRCDPNSTLSVLRPVQSNSNHRIPARWAGKITKRAVSRSPSRKATKEVEILHPQREQSPFGPKIQRSIAWPSALID